MFVRIKIIIKSIEKMKMNKSLSENLQNVDRNKPSLLYALVIRKQALKTYVAQFHRCLAKTILNKVTILNGTYHHQTSPSDLG